MASTAADIIASAKTEAEAARQSALSSLSGLGTNLETGYNTQVQSTKDYYTNMMNNLQNAYNTNAKSAYGNYQSDMSILNNNLARLGLQNSGYGISQQLLAGSGYSKNLATLQSALQTNQANLGVDQSKQLADLYNTYLTNKNSIDKYLYEAGQNAYNTSYSNTYQAYQDAIANDLAERQLALQQASLYASRSGGGYSGGGGGGSNDPEDETPLGQNNDKKSSTQLNTSGWTSTAMSMSYANTKSSVDDYGTFSNGYQPKGISGYGKLTPSNQYITVNGKQQNVWLTTGDGKTRAWYWDGKSKTYVGISF